MCFQLAWNRAQNGVLHRRTKLGTGTPPHLKHIKLFRDGKLTSSSSCMSSSSSSSLSLYPGGRGGPMSSSSESSADPWGGSGGPISSSSKLSSLSLLDELLGSKSYRKHKSIYLIHCPLFHNKYTTSEVTTRPFSLRHNHPHGRAQIGMGNTMPGAGSA